MTDKTLIDTVEELCDALDELIGLVKSFDGPAVEDGLYDPCIIEAHELATSTREKIKAVAS